MNDNENCIAAIELNRIEFYPRARVLEISLYEIYL